MPRKDELYGDQTSFVDQAPTWQQATEKKISLRENLQKNKNLRPFYILIAFLVLLFLILLFVRLNPQPVKEVEEASNVQVEERIDLDPLEERIQSLQRQLELAEPTRQDLPFPNVDLELSLP